METVMSITDQQTVSYLTPVLFLIFNRLDTTKQVFAVIRQLKPKYLYVASDGARDNRLDEKDKVLAVRDYVMNNIDWDCEVKTLFRGENLGCGRDPADAIIWFFEQVESGIILEDDCVPSLSFFAYCAELLEKYKNDSRIYHIAGFSPLDNINSPYSYYFAAIQQCTGWATWRRSWSKFQFDVEQLSIKEFIAKNKIKKIFQRKCDQKYWQKVFCELGDSSIKNHIWDIQWTFAILNNNGICINPTKNLISNIGFGESATHTVGVDSIYARQSFDITEIKHPANISIDTRLDIEINKVEFRIYSLYDRLCRLPLKFGKFIEMLVNSGCRKTCQYIYIRNIFNYA